MWEIIPKISVTIYATSLFIISLWYSIGVMNKRTFWFSFLKITDVFGVLFLLELTSRWYFAIRADGEHVVFAIFLAILAAFCSLVIVGVALGIGVFLYFCFKRIYHFSLSGPIEKTKARTKRWLDGNWRLADNIVKKGLLQAFKDYWGF